MCRAIDDERKGKPQVHVFSQNDRNVKEFWDEVAKFDASHSGWANGIPTISPDDGKDEEWEKATEQKMFQLSDASGNPFLFSLPFSLIFACQLENQLFLRLSDLH